MSLKEADQLRIENPDKYIKESYRTMGEHWNNARIKSRVAITFDYGNNLRGQAKANVGVRDAFDFLVVNI